ncbi:MAG: MMPL family transporter [Planctomycetaceae bacterium]
MRVQSSFFQRWSWVVVLVAAASAPLLAYGVRGALRGGDNDVRQWLPAGSRETTEYDWFLKHFGSEEIAVVSWPGATLDDERLDRVAEGLRAYVSAGPSAASDPTEASSSPRSSEVTPLFSRVVTSREALAELTGEPLKLSRNEATHRLRGTLLGPGDRTSALVVMVNEAGAANRKSALELIARVAWREASLTRDELRMGGPTVESVALESESRRSRYLLAAISVVVALTLAWRCLREWRLVCAVFATAILSATSAVALVYFTGETMNLLLGMMPTLVYVVALSSAVHLVNYYRDALADAGTAGAPLAAFRAGWLPCLLSSGTTAVGLGSLAISEIGPVREFGIYSAAGVLISLPLLLLFLPSVLQIWPSRRHSSRSVVETNVGSVGFAERVADRIIRHRRWVAAVGLSLMVPLGLSVLRLDTSVKLLNLFSPDARIIRDYTWLEQHLGPLVPVEVVLRFSDDDSLSMFERMRLVDDVQRTLESIDEVGGTMSAATFAPPLPDGTGARQMISRRMLDRTFERNRAHFTDAGFVREVKDGELWRVSARVAALNSVDYGEFMGRVAARVEPLLADASTAGDEPIDATYTGIVPLIYKAQRTLLNDLSSSFATAFLIIGVVMAVTLRGVGAGLVSMVPNVFPAVTVFGVMALSGMPCDIGSMMTAGVALGIAVDDTIHYLGWFRRGLADGLTRHEAIATAYERCAGAMVQTTVICGLGLLVFAFSSFVPTAHFAWLMAAMLGTALIGDLLLLPALLAGPLGKLFERPEVVDMPVEAAAPIGRLAASS